MKKRDKGLSKGRNKSLFIWIMTGIAVVTVILVATGRIPINKDRWHKVTVEKGKSFQITEKETKPVLDPSLFTGMTRSAYEAAKRHPDAMNEVFCYCYCDQPPFNHKSLLSCFTDEHGAG
ncbi:MAG: hypothetical protein Fur0020_01780 [Thermodesulfovibrionia bacterium]